jgi:hypothetical protein
MANLTIDELLKSLQSPSEKQGKLQNTQETWTRIGEKDGFAELGLGKTELESFLSEWVKDNPYNNI